MSGLQKLLRALRTMMFLALVLSLAGSLTAEPKKTERQLSDQRAIEAIIERLPEAVLKREVDTLVAILTDSVEVSIYGRAAKGKENIRSLLNVGLTRFIDVRVETKTHELEVGENRAAQVGYFRYTIEWPMGGTTVRDGDFVAQWERIKKKWLLSGLVVTLPKPDDTAQEDQ